MDPLVGKRVGNYIVAEMIGEGGMGAVYRAEHPDIGRRVAVKVLDARLGDYPEVCKRFLTEARAIARIEHPNVIDIFDFGRTLDGQLYYVMELLKGMELRAIIEQRGAMPVEEVQPYLEQICDGLQAAHDHEVVHRDLKPENIFILDSGRLALKLIDFGIARLDDPQFSGPAKTAKGVVMGTPLTISPEQAEGQPDKIGRRSDIYSLGVILYWMLTGRPPFVDEPPAVILARHITDEPPSLRELVPTVPGAVAELVHQCLSKAPEDRPGSAMEIAKRFAQAVGPLLRDRSGPVASLSGLMRSAGPPDIARAETMPPDPREPEPASDPRPGPVAQPPEVMLPAPEPPAPPPVLPPPTSPAPTPPPPTPPVASSPVSPPPRDAGPIQRVPSAEELLGALTGGEVEVDGEEDEVEPSIEEPEDEPVVEQPDPEPAMPVDAAEEPWPPADQPEQRPDSGLLDDLPPFSVDDNSVSVTPLPGQVVSREPRAARPWTRPALIGGGAAVLVVAVVVVLLLASGSDEEPASTTGPTPPTTPAQRLELTQLPPLRGAAVHGLAAGEAQYQNGDLNGAIRSYKAALKAAPGNARLLFRLGEALQAAGEEVEAAPLLRRALEADASLAAAVHFKLGDGFESQGQASQAIAEYKEAIAAGPRYAPPLVALGFTYARLRRYDDAIARLDRAVQLAPNNPQAHYYRGTVLFNLDRANEAIESYRAAIKLKSRYPEAHYYLGQVYLKLKQTEEARREFKAALADDPEYEPAALALTKLK